MIVTQDQGMMKLEPETVDEAFQLGDVFGRMWDSGTVETSGGCLHIRTGAITMEEHEKRRDVETASVTGIGEIAISDTPLLNSLKLVTEDDCDL